MILVIDNYDSFTFNLVQLLYGLGAEVKVVRNDAIDLTGIRAENPSHLVISPGPCTPREAGVSVEAIVQSTVPVFGVCLGHQAIGAAFGGNIVRGREPVHGKSAEINHDGTGIFTNTPPRFEAARYHSLMVDPDTLPSVLEAIARTDDGTLMALRHQSRPIVGVQFHPESILTPEGSGILRNFLEGRW